MQQIYPFHSPEQGLVFQLHPVTSIMWSCKYKIYSTKLQKKNMVNVQIICGTDCL